jgi:hypothetical protein
MTTTALEISRFTDTGKTITHRHREYDILTPPDDEDRADSPYILRSKPKRGPVRYYALTRNVPNPSLMFGVSLYGSMSVLDGWFSDASGTLVSQG